MFLFFVDVNTSKVTTVVHGVLGGVAEFFLKLLSNDGEEGVRFNGVTEDACISSVNHCDITKGEIIQYTNELPVDIHYPLVCLSFSLSCDLQKKELWYDCIRINYPLMFN